MLEEGASQKLKVFISYSRKDIAFADRLVAALDQRGFEVLIDRRDLPKLEDWERELLGFIRQADTVVYIVSPASLSSRVCAWEIEQVGLQGKRLAPVVIANVESVPVPKEISRINFIFFNDDAGAPGSHFDSRIDELSKALNTDVKWLKEHTRLGELSNRWDLKNKTSALLLRGVEIAEAEQWLSTRPREAPAPTDLQRSYILASRSAAARRSRYWVTGSTIAAAIAIALALTAFFERQVARENELRALRNFDAARDAVDKIGLTVAKDLRSIVGMPQNVIRTMLLQSQSIIDKLDADDAGSRVLMRSRASLLNEFAKTYWFIGDTDRALSAASECVEIAGRLLKDAPRDMELANIVYDASLAYGDVVQVKGDAQSALKAFERGQAALGPILDEPNSGEEAWRRLAWAIDRAGDIHRRDGRFNEAAQKFAEAERIRQRFLKYNPESDLWLTDLSWGHNRVGDNARENDDLRPRLLRSAREGIPMVSDQPQKWSKALASYRAALDIRRSLAEKAPNDSVRQRNLSWSLNLVGLALLATGQAADATAHHRESREVLQKLLANDDRNTQWLRDLAITQNHLGDAALARAEADTAVLEYQRAIELREKLGSIDRNNARWIGEIKTDRDRLAEVCDAIACRRAP